MKSGYELVHPNSVLELMRFKKNHELCVALLSWAIEKANSELAEKLRGVELAVIRVTLHGGSYPAIGLRSDNLEINLEPLAEELEEDIDAILRKASVVDFVNYFATKRDE